MQMYHLLKIFPTFTKKRICEMKELLAQALRMVGRGGVRSLMTVTVIAVGITSLTGVTTAIDAIDDHLERTYSKLGRGTSIIRSKKGEAFTKREIELFRKSYQDKGVMTIIEEISFGESVITDSGESNPVYHIIASDENYISFCDIGICSGRNFTPEESECGKPVCLLPQEITSPVVSVCGRKYHSIGRHTDKEKIIIPYTSVTIADPAIGVRGKDPQEALERIRKECTVTRSDPETTGYSKAMGALSIAAFIIGSVTMLAASINVMNSMLVSVKEQKREIGVMKATGASNRYILRLYLLQPLLLSLAGSLLGVPIGTAGIYLILVTRGIEFHFPWSPIISSIAASVTTALISGYLPAKRAATTEPVEALRSK